MKTLFWSLTPWMVLGGIIILITLSGCSAFKYYYPEQEALADIAFEHPNCAVVSVLAEEHLKSVGLQAEIKCNQIPMDAEPTLLQKTLNPDELTVRTVLGHCWIEVVNPEDGETYMLDPALGIGGFQVKYYPERY